MVWAATKRRWALRNNRMCSGLLPKVAFIRLTGKIEPNPEFFFRSLIERELPAGCPSRHPMEMFR